jgi:hypothetical protein
MCSQSVSSLCLCSCLIDLKYVIRDAVLPTWAGLSTDSDCRCSVYLTSSILARDNCVAQCKHQVICVFDESRNIFGIFGNQFLHATKDLLYPVLLISSVETSIQLQGRNGTLNFRFPSVEISLKRIEARIVLLNWNFRKWIQVTRWIQLTEE